MAVSRTLSHTVTMPAGKRQISPLIRAPRVEVSPSSPSTEIGDSPAPTVRRTRTGRPKVKTGCITCKIRRVKCDETKPECERCTSTGRKCDGYVTHPPKRAAPKSKTNDQLVLYSGIDWEQGSSAERRAIDFFRSRTAPNISGYFDSDFWNCFVVQVSQSEPAVRHALAAVGALNERLDVYVQNMKHNISAIHIVPQPHTLASISSNRRDEHNDPFALAQYNKAIKHLANQIKQPSPASVDTTLLLSVLFVCVECLRGDYQPALKHFQAGMSVALASNGGKSFNSPGSPSSSIRDKVTPFLNRLELLSMLFGICPDYDYGLGPSETVPSSFASILEARDSLVHIMNLSTRFIRHTKELRYTNGITAADILHYSKLLACLSDWKRTLDTYLTTQTPTPHLAEAAATLEIHQLAALTWLNRSLTNRESATDADIPLYERAVCLAESLQQSTTPQTTLTKSQHQPSTFLFDMEFVSPLYLCAMKCRQPLIRRRAIAALRRCTRREGLWDSQKAAAIAERIAEVEEEGMEVLDGSALPSEERRVHFCHIDSKPGVDPTGHGLTFHALPEGPEGGWRVWTEVLVLG